MMMPSPRSAEELLRRALASDDTIAAIKQDPEGELRKLAREVVRDAPTFESDPWLYRMIVFVIGLTALVSVIGAVIVATWSTTGQVPDILTALGSGSIGALAGFLTPIQYRR